MGSLFNKQQGALKKRVDFQNPETQKALKKLAEFLKNNFDLPEGESYQSVAEDAIAEAIQAPLVVSNIPLHESIYSRALSACNSWVGDKDSEEDSQELDETSLEDVYQVIESICFIGSEKQIKWARDIAHKAAEDIALIWKSKNVDLSTSAKWWIDNRNDIYGALNK